MVIVEGRRSLQEATEDAAFPLDFNFHTILLFIPNVAIVILVHFKLRKQLSAPESSSVPERMINPI
jgi:hypothetical protein